ncbi:hypothetical protein GW915_11640 [bacterium]|nr:hypothetical protein [bacterium]
MNFSAAIATTLTVLVLYFGVFTSSDRPEIFLDSHAFLLVFGGTIIASLYSFSMKKLLNIAKNYIKIVYFTDKTDAKKIVSTVLELSQAAKKGNEALRAVKITHPFFRDGVEALADKVVPLQDFRAHMINKLKIVNAEYQSDADIIQSIAKYPPAFGLLGAVTGMISMMGQLSGGVEKIGMSMATALVATFWGIGLANFILLPMADYYKKLSAEDLKQRSIILEGIYLIKRKDSSVLIQEKMLSFVPIKDHKKFKEQNNLISDAKFARAA